MSSQSGITQGPSAELGIPHLRQSPRVVETFDTRRLKVNATREQRHRHFCHTDHFVLFVSFHSFLAFNPSKRASEPSMSLTSRLSNWFSQDSSVPHSLEAQRNDAYSESDFDIDGARQIKRPRTAELLAEEHVDIESKRPPYLHVCAQSQHPTCHVADRRNSQCLLEE